MTFRLIKRIHNLEVNLLKEEYNPFTPADVHDSLLVLCAVFEHVDCSSYMQEIYKNLLPELLRDC